MDTMASHSFSIRTASDLLDKFEEDFKLLQSNPLSSSKALDCVFSAWHMSDWWYEATPNPTEPGKKEYQRKLRSKHDFMRFMADIVNGSKHVRLSDKNVLVVDTKAVEGDFNEDWGDDFSLSGLKLILADGSERDFITELDNALRYWRGEMGR